MYKISYISYINWLDLVGPIAFISTIALEKTDLANMSRRNSRPYITCSNGPPNCWIRGCIFLVIPSYNCAYDRGVQWGEISFTPSVYRATTVERFGVMFFGFPTLKPSKLWGDCFGSFS